MYDECPIVCYKISKRPEEKKDDFCGTCDIKIAKEFFEEETIKLLDERLGDSWKSYGFKNLYNQVRETFDIEPTDPKISITAKSMVDILESEKNRQRRIEDWNRKEAKDK